MPRWQAWGATLVAWTTFVLLFSPVTAMAGTGSASILIFIPVGTAAWAFGARGGLLAAVMALGVNAGGLWIVDGDLHDMADVGYVLGHGVLVVFGLTVGYALDASRRYRRELHARLSAEGMAESASQEFLAAFEGSPNAMFVTDASGSIVRANRALAAVTGVPIGSLEGRPAEELFLPGDRAELTALLGRLSRGTQLQGAVDLCVAGAEASGEDTWVAASLTAIRRSGGGSVGIVVHLQDVTERRRALQHLEDLVRLKDEFVAAVSHELRTPLTTVMGLAHEMSQAADSWTENERDEIARLIHSSSQELSGIVEDLLVAAKAEIGAVGVTSGLVRLEDEVRRVVGESSRLGDRNVVVEGSAGAFADRRRVRQIIRNLLTNADRYGGPRVWVRVGAENGVAFIDVCDDGPGVPPAAEEAIFKAYVRAGSGTLPGSLGLGLAVSTALANLMGGRLSYRRDDLATVFRLALPPEPSHGALGVLAGGVSSN